MSRTMKGVLPFVVLGEFDRKTSVFPCVLGFILTLIGSHPLLEAERSIFAVAYKAKARNFAKQYFVLNNAGELVTNRNYLEDDEQSQTVARFFPHGDPTESIVARTQYEQSVAHVKKLRCPFRTMLLQVGVIMYIASIMGALGAVFHGAKNDFENLVRWSTAWAATLAANIVVYIVYMTAAAKKLSPAVDLLESFLASKILIVNKAMGSDYSLHKNARSYLLTKVGWVWPSLLVIALGAVFMAYHKAQKDQENPSSEETQPIVVPDNEVAEELLASA